MTTLNATFINKDDNRPDGTQVFWFDVNGETYGVIQGGDSHNANVVDCDGCPTDVYSVDQFNITKEMITS